MAGDPTEEEIRRQISDAVRILKEDGVHVRRHVQALLDERFPKDNPPKDDPPKDGPPKDPGEGDPPPPKDPPENKEKKGLWWR